MLIRRTPGLLLLLLGIGLLLAGCGGGPDAANVEKVVQARVAQAFPDGAVSVSSFRRLGSSPLAAGEDGRARRIVYYNTALTLDRDIDFSSWQGLNVAAVANLLGATEKGISGLKQGGNRKGDTIYVYGTVTYVADGEQWQPVQTARTQVAEAPPEDNTGPPAIARQIIENIQALFAQAGTAEERRAIITDELGKAYGRMRLRLDRLGRSFVVAGGPEAGEYQQVAALIAAKFQQAGVPSRAVSTAGSIENVGLLADRLADVALVQNDVAMRAVEGRAPFARDAVPELRALASLFPENVHVILSPGAQVASLADLQGKRVDVGLPNSGTRIDAEAMLKAVGLTLADLSIAAELGLAAGLEGLQRGELDAVIATISAPARRVQAMAAGGGLRLLSLSEAEQSRLIAANAGFVAAVLPPSTYPGQSQPVRTVAVAALLASRADLPDGEAETLLRDVFGGIDFIAAGSAAGSQISRANARTGVGIPWHPAAEKFFASASQ
jgi:TRAP transporter TAXI family solute receptor